PVPKRPEGRRESAPFPPHGRGGSLVSKKGYPPRGGRFHQENAMNPRSLILLVLPLAACGGGRPPPPPPPPPPPRPPPPPADDHPRGRHGDHRHRRAERHAARGRRAAAEGAQGERHQER